MRVAPDLLRDRLRSSLGTAGALERELGGGGMSRVFLAEDAALGRRIVVKVLAPEPAEGLWLSASRARSGSPRGCSTRTRSRCTPPAQAPVADVRVGTPTVFDVAGEDAVPWRLALEGVERRADDVLWLRYRVVPRTQSA